MNLFCFLVSFVVATQLSAIDFSSSEECCELSKIYILYCIQNKNNYIKLIKYFYRDEENGTEKAVMILHLMCFLQKMIFLEDQAYYKKLITNCKIDNKPSHIGFKGNVLLYLVQKIFKGPKLSYNIDIKDFETLNLYLKKTEPHGEYFLKIFRPKDTSLDKKDKEKFRKETKIQKITFLHFIDSLMSIVNYAYKILADELREAEDKELCLKKQDELILNFLNYGNMKSIISKIEAEGLGYTFLVFNSRDKENFADYFFIDNLCELNNLNYKNLNFKQKKKHAKSSKLFLECITELHNCYLVLGEIFADCILSIIKYQSECYKIDVVLELTKYGEIQFIINCPIMTEADFRLLVSIAKTRNI